MHPRYKFLLPLLLCVFCFSAASLSAAKKPDKDFSDKVYAELPKIHPNIADGPKRNLNRAYSQVNNLLNSKGKDNGILPNSYDEAFLSRLKSQILLLQNKYSAAIPPLERTLAIAKLHDHFFSHPEVLETILFLSQINYQVAADARSPETQKKHYDQAIRYIKQWLDESTTPSQRNLIFASSLYYQIATLDPKNVDKNHIRTSLDFGWKSLVAEIKPAEQSYQIILACLLQLEDYLKAADILEASLEKNPKNASYWQQLVGIYYALAGKASDEKNPSEANRYSLLAALTIENAQKHGYMGGNKDNFNLVAIYYSIKQYDQAAQLIERFVAEKKIDPEKRVFDLLSNAYHELKQGDKAIDALKRAAEIYTDNADLEFTIAQFSYANNDKQNSYGHLLKAIEKGYAARPGALRIFLAYVCFELQKYKEALKWIDEAGEKADAKKPDVERLKKAILEAIKEEETRAAREKAEAAKEAAEQQPQPEKK